MNSNRCWWWTACWRTWYVLIKSIRGLDQIRKSEVRYSGHIRVPHGKLCYSEFPRGPWDEQKEALRTFALDRMRAPRIAKAAARNMDVDELDASLTVGYGLFAGPVEDLARLVFEQPLGEWVSKEIWHPDQQGRLREDGRYELTLPYSDGRELLGEILRHGGQVRVEAPESLVALVRDSLRATLSLYAD